MRSLRTNPAVKLTARDLVDHEDILAEGLAAYIPFKASSLYFPKEPPEALRGPGKPEGVGGLWRAHYLREERKVQIPLCLDGRFLAVFLARGVRLAAPSTLCRVLPVAAADVLERLLLHKIGVTDARTGLATADALAQALAREIRAIRRAAPPVGRSGGRKADGSAAQGPNMEAAISLPAAHAGLGLAVFRLAGLDAVARRHGHTQADALLGKLAQALDAAKPEGALAARLGDAELGLLVPGGSLKRVDEAVGAVLERAKGLAVTNPLTEERVAAPVTAGSAVFPRDMKGAVLDRPAPEQARRLLDKALMGLAHAVEPGEHVTFGRILAEGGRVLEALPMGRVRLSLGRLAGAVEGMRFLVWSGVDRADAPAPSFKAELSLVEVLDDVSVAEVLRQGESGGAASGPMAGDRLTLAPHGADDQAEADAAETAGRLDPGTGLPSFRGFLARFAERRELVDRFCLAMVRLDRNGAGTLAVGRQASGHHAHLERLMAEAARQAADDGGPQTLGGRYALNTLVFFHPGEEAADLAPRYAELAARLSERLDCRVCVGLAPHPMLHFPKAEALDNAVKALEYAVLLPAPHVGVLDSLALTISADALFGRGDVYGAIEAYKTALLADEANVLARVSLGVCLARLDRPAEAKREFEKALSAEPGNVQALYNLGYVSKKLGETKAARAAYQKCLKRAPGHAYALLRLGRLAQAEGRKAQAATYFHRALAQAQVPEGEALIRRQLARLELERGDTEAAREHLHRALVNNPRDAVSLSLMAGLYLDGGEDPAVAEVLARQAVAARPELAATWSALARAFEAQGKTDEAAQALARAQGG